MAAHNHIEEALLDRIDASRIREQLRSRFTTNPQEIYLPFPPSVNAIYANVPGRGRVKSERYRTWETAANWDFARQKPKRYKGAVEIWVYLEDSSATRGDADNRLKAILDSLVAHSIIENDTKKIVRSVHVIWSPETRGCRVSIRPAPAHGGTA